MNSILRESLSGADVFRYNKTMEVTNIVFSMAFLFSYISQKVPQSFFLVKRIVVLEDLILLRDS